MPTHPNATVAICCGSVASKMAPLSAINWTGFCGGHSSNLSQLQAESLAFLCSPPIVRPVELTSHEIVILAFYKNSLEEPWRLVSPQVDTTKIEMQDKRARVPTLELAPKRVPCAGTSPNCPGDMKCNIQNHQPTDPFFDRDPRAQGPWQF